MHTPFFFSSNFIQSEYIFQGYKRVLQIEVKFYKLPKFKVQIEAPSYIYPGSSGITIKLKGT